MATIKITDSTTGGGPTTAPIGPLASLYTNKYKTNTYQYPRDLDASYRGHAVEFQFVEVSGLGLEQAKKALTGLVENEGIQKLATTAAAATGAGAVAYGLTGNKTISALTALGVGAKLGGGDQLLDVTTGALDAIGGSSLLGGATSGDTTGIQISPALTNIRDKVMLYMPETLEFSYESNYSDLSIAEAASAITNRAGGQGLTSAVEDPLVKLALNRAGYVFNPQQQLLFNGIDFRTYQMSFTFTPYSRDEANAVQEIIKTFRKYAAPTVVTESAGFFFIPPGMVDITFKKDGMTNDKLHKLKRSVLESVTVNYAPNGWTSMEDGAPTQTTMTLSFKEMQLVDRKDIEKGF